MKETIEEAVFLGKGPFGPLPKNLQRRLISGGLIE